VSIKKILVSVSEPLLNGNEKKYLLSCLKTNSISSSGNFVKKFENKFASYVDRRHGIAVSSGTAALQVAVDALKLKKGDEVILPAFTIISCILPLVRTGIVPILIDSDLKTWNMDVLSIKKKITKKTKAIIVPHIYGLPVEMSPIIRIAKKFKLKIIEDAAEVLGLEYNKKKCGSFGDISIFSFYANKHITTGEGGMIVTNNDKIAEDCRGLRNICFNEKRRFSHDQLGWNFRMTNFQAAIGLAQLEDINKKVKKKRSIGNFYNQKFKDCRNIILPLAETSYAKNIYWVYGIIIKKKINLKKITDKLLKKGIETRPFFWPLNKQPILNKLGYFKNLKMPKAEYLADRGFYIPSGLSLTKIQQQHVVEVFKKVIQKI
jgi:perosamine synthetase